MVRDGVHHTAIATFYNSSLHLKLLTMRMIRWTRGHHSSIIQHVAIIMPAMTTMMSALKCHHTTAWDDDVDGDGDIKDDVSSEMSPHSGLRCWRCWWDDDDDVTTIMSPHGGRPHNVFFSQSFQCCHWLTMNSAQKKSCIHIQCECGGGMCGCTTV